MLGTRVDSLTLDGAARRIVEWAEGSAESRYVCVANVHMVMEGHDDPAFQRIVNDAAMVTSDGMPLVWALRAQGEREAERVYGPDLTLRVCELAAQHGVPVAFYGGTPEILAQMERAIADRCPGLQVACAIAPPFRPLTPEEDETYTDALRASGARLVFVGIGCPKQEKFMAAHRGRLPGVMIGVGAAFDMYAGRVRQAPVWMQRRGLEWLFRLAVEPRRLWRRYLRHNPRFVAHLGLDLGRRLLVRKRRAA